VTAPNPVPHIPFGLSLPFDKLRANGSFLTPFGLSLFKPSPHPQPFDKLRAHGSSLTPFGLSLSKPSPHPQPFDKLRANGVC
jgi:hypothetical protein